MDQSQWKPGLRATSVMSLLPHCIGQSKSNSQTQDQRGGVGETDSASSVGGTPKSHGKDCWYKEV